MHILLGGTLLVRLKVLRKIKTSEKPVNKAFSEVLITLFSYSHSIVAGGFEVIS